MVDDTQQNKPQVIKDIPPDRWESLADERFLAEKTDELNLLKRQDLRIRINSYTCISLKGIGVDDELFQPSPSGEIEAVIYDISDHGLSIFTNAFLEQGNQVEILVPAVSLEVPIYGQVSRCANLDERVNEIGICFQDKVPWLRIVQMINPGLNELRAA